MKNQFIQESNMSVNHCKYKATSLLQHIKTVHKGVHFKCDTCEYEAKWKHARIRHIGNVMMGLNINVINATTRLNMNLNGNMHCRDM